MTEADLIDTREALINALHEAGEIEHGLMVQYLFAALTLKKRLDEGISPAQQELIRAWEGRVLEVAREEMVHLGTVCNLLTSIGGAPQFGRPNFPQPARSYYPFAFGLIRYSDEALYRFVRFELPKGEVPPKKPGASSRERRLMEALVAPVDPEPVEYNYVGELYLKIRGAFANLPEDELFIGPRAAQDLETWSRRMQILRVVDRKTANDAIDFIVQEGEGSPGNRKGSHYQTFLDLRDQLAANAPFDPARDVVHNPRTRMHRDAPAQGTLLENNDALEVAHLFNATYAAVLLMLTQLYSHGGETLGERTALRNAARQMMTMAVRPIAEILTDLPALKDTGAGRAGPPFELAGPPLIPSQVDTRSVVLAERLSAIARDARSLIHINQRLGFIADNVGLINTNLRNARQAEERL